MQYRLRTLMFAVLLVGVAASFHQHIQDWWLSRTRPEVTFVGNSIAARDLAIVAGVPRFAELTPQQISNATTEIVRAYRKMGYLKARLAVERVDTTLGWATRFIVNEGQRYDADEVTEIVGSRMRGMNCSLHGNYLCEPEGDVAATSRPCPICGRVTGIERRAPGVDQREPPEPSPRSVDRCGRSRHGTARESFLADSSP